MPDNDDLRRLTIADLDFRARLGATWKIDGAREDVARAARAWADEILGPPAPPAKAPARGRRTRR